MLSTSAFNALLKTLEEPPAHVKFIFATTDPHKLPATVQSRCQRYDFRRIPLRLVVERLQQIVAGGEDRDQRRARSSCWRARARAACATRSRCSTRCSPAPAESVRDEDVLDTLGAGRPAGDRRASADAIIARDATRVLEPLDEAYRHGCDLRRFTRDLLEHFRNLAVAKVSGGTLLPDVADEEVAALREQAGRIAAEDLRPRLPDLLETDEEVAQARRIPSWCWRWRCCAWRRCRRCCRSTICCNASLTSRGARALRRRRAPCQHRRRPAPRPTALPQRAPPTAAAPRARRAAARRCRRRRRRPASAAGKRSSPLRRRSVRRWPSTSPSARCRGSTTADRHRSAARLPRRLSVAARPRGADRGARGALLRSPMRVQVTAATPRERRCGRGAARRRRPS